MPIAIKQNELYVKDSNGEYLGVNVVGDSTKAQVQALIQTAGTTQINAINTKAAEVTSQLANAGEMEAMLAGTFSASKAYKAGEYVIQTVNSENKLYRFTKDHAAGAWIGTSGANADVREVKLADDTTEIKSALLLNEENYSTKRIEWESGGINGSTGEDANNSYSVRCKGYVRFDDNDTVIIPKTLGLIAFRYTLSDYTYTFVDRITDFPNSGYQFDDGYYYRFTGNTNPISQNPNVSLFDAVLFYTQNASKKEFENACDDSGYSTSFSVGNMPTEPEATLPTTWWIPLNCVVPKNAYIESIEFNSAITGVRSFQLGLFRELQDTDGTDGYFECVEKISWVNYIKTGSNTIELNFGRCKSQCFIGIRPIYNDFLRFDREDGHYGYYNFAESDWLDVDPFRLSYSVGTVNYVENSVVRKRLNCIKVNYRFADTPYVGKRIAVVGDSIQINNLYRTYYQWYELLGSKMGFTFVSFASGGRAYDPQMGGGTGMAQYIGKIGQQKYNPDAIIVFAGTNDYAGALIPLGTKESASDYTTVCGCMKRAYDTIQLLEPYTPTLIVSPTPRGVLVDNAVVNCLGVPNSQGYTLQDLVDAEKDLSLLYGFFFYNMTERSALNPCLLGTANEMYNGDYLHPSLKGHEAMSAQLYDTVVKLFTIVPNADDYLESPWDT